MRYFSSKSLTKIPMNWEGREPLKWDKTIILCVVHIPGKLLVPETSAYACLCHLITTGMVKSDLGSPGCLSRPSQSYNANFNVGFWEFSRVVALLGTSFIKDIGPNRISMTLLLRSQMSTGLRSPTSCWIWVQRDPGHVFGVTGGGGRQPHYLGVMAIIATLSCWGVSREAVGGESLYSWTKRHSSGHCLCTGSFQPVNMEQASDHHYHTQGLLPSDLLHCSKERKEERQSTFKLQRPCFRPTACHTSFWTWKEKNAFHTSGLKPQTFVWLSFFWT